MAIETQAAARESRTTQATEGRPVAQQVLRPPVDIYEDPEGITLLADMPGVSRERLELRVENNTLLIEGQIELELPAGAEALHADLRSRRYRRSFALSQELDTEHVSATLRDGVLNLRIPKRAELRPRRIEIQGA